MIRAPELTHSIIAAASSSSVAPGICPLPLGASAKTGLRNSVHPGQIAGATEPRRAKSIPATNVPCVHATVSAMAHAPFGFPETPLLEISSTDAAARSGWFRATGPSINAIAISGMPWPRSIKAASRTRFTGPIVYPAVFQLGIPSQLAPPDSDTVDHAERSCIFLVAIKIVLRLYWLETLAFYNPRVCVGLRAAPAHELDFLW